jgi:methyl-accepting chemotaxis protein
MAMEQSIVAPLGVGRTGQVPGLIRKGGMFEWLRKFTIKTRVIGSFASGAVLTAGLGVLGYVSEDKRLYLCAVAYVIVASLFFGWWIAGSIIGPIERLRLRLHDVAEGEGDLTKRFPDLSNDEIGAAAGWFNVFMEKLHAIVSQVAHTSSQVAAAAGRLRTSSERIAGSSEGILTQASAVAAAAGEVATTSEDIAGNCRSASEEVRRAELVAQNGAEVVQKSVTVMARIAERVQGSTRTVESLGARSDQIGTIISTIGDIADQTNLLALNAAIEAARAGDQGRGFAVVADEVRALAERTLQAAREIDDMIKAIQSDIRDAVATMGQSLHQVAEGTAETEKSGEALQHIRRQIGTVAVLVDRIAEAASEQTASTNDITGSIRAIVDAAQATTRSARESAAASSQLHGSADGLQRLIGRFKL